MPFITMECCNPGCSREVRKYYNPRFVPPKYCSVACSRAYSRTFVFTDAMNESIRVAYRSGYGCLMQLWREDARFGAAGISYGLVKRQVLVLRLRRVDELYAQRPWTAEELALTEDLWSLGSSPDVISAALARKGWRRSPGAVIAAMERPGRRGQRHGSTLSTREVAEALGVDIGTVLDWAARGWLPVHHMSAGPDKPQRFFSWEAVRRFVIAHPAKVAHGHPDVVFLIGLLSEPRVGWTGDSACVDEDGAWMNGEPMRDRASVAD